MVADEDVLARVLRDLHINFASMSEFTLQPKQEFCPLDTPFIKCCSCQELWTDRECVDSRYLAFEKFFEYQVQEMESLGFHLILSSLSTLPDSYCIESRNQEENKNPSVWLV